MNKPCLIICILASLFVFISASVWEGTAAISYDLPETGLYISTNSFPINTVVDVENLENGRRIGLIVRTRLDIPGFLALISRDAASAIDIADRSISRIRMRQSDDPWAFSHYSGGRTATAAGGISPHESTDVIAYDEGGFYENMRMDSGELIVDLPVNLDPLPEPAYVVQVPPPAPVTSPDFESIRLVPSDVRPPDVVTSVMPDPDYFIPQIISPAPMFHPPAPVPPPPPAPVQVVAPPPITPSVFSAPMITRLETGMYYVQIAAYSRPEAVQAEISRLDRNLPVVIMNAGSAYEPVYRILIGPLNLGESGAMHQRFRNTHSDAFVRQGS